MAGDGERSIGTADPVLFFLSDYGTADEFVGVVHAVLHRWAPGGAGHRHLPPDPALRRGRRLGHAGQSGSAPRCRRGAGGGGPRGGHRPAGCGPRSGVGPAPLDGGTGQRAPGAASHVPGRGADGRGTGPRTAGAARTVGHLRRAGRVRPGGRPSRHRRCPRGDRDPDRSGHPGGAARRRVGADGAPGERAGGARPGVLGDVDRPVRERPALRGPGRADRDRTHRRRTRWSPSKAAPRSPAGSPGREWSRVVRPSSGGGSPPSGSSAKGSSG